MLILRKEVSRLSAAFYCILEDLIGAFYSIALVEGPLQPVLMVGISLAFTRFTCNPASTLILHLV